MFRRKLLVYACITVLLTVGLAAGALFAEEPIRILGTVAFSGAAGNIGPPYDKAMKFRASSSVVSRIIPLKTGFFRYGPNNLWSYKFLRFLKLTGRLTSSGLYISLYFPGGQEGG